MKNSYFLYITFIPVLIFLFTACVNQNGADATLFIDNYSGVDILMKKDNKDWFRAKDQSSRKEYLPPGEYSFSQINKVDSVVLDSLRVELFANKKYVINLLGGATYLSDKTVVLSKGNFDLNKTLEGGKLIEKRFFEATEKHILEFSDNFSGVSKNKLEQETYLLRISAEEIESSQITANDYWKKEINGMGMELLSEGEKNKVYDIIRADSVCESIQSIELILKNDHSILKEKCFEIGNLRKKESLEGWDVAENRLIQSILGTIPSEELNSNDKLILDDLVKEENFEGYFEVLDSIDPQVNDLVALQARYNRLCQVRLNEGDSGYLTMFENRLRLAIGFKLVKQEQK